MKNKKGITLVALVVTIIILLILAGITISILGGENGLMTKASQARKAQIEAEIEEELILAIQELQVEKQGKATLDDITQEWIDSKLTKYENKVTEDASINGKKIRIEKNEVIKKYIIDDKFKLTEINNGDDLEFSYDVGERIGEKVKILIHIQDKERGLSKIELPDADVIAVIGNKREEKAIDYEVEIGKEYKIKITLENGEIKEETILLEDYWHTITKNIPEGIFIDNTAIKAAYNKPYVATITAANEYLLQTLSVTMEGKTTTIDVTTGIINIEKITGDIVITATAKKLEVQTSTPIISTSTSATSSNGANTVERGTALYIKFSATLNVTGGTCTIDKEIPYKVTESGKYIFVITGTYGEKIVKKELEVIVDQYEIQGAFVQYDAGDWTEEEIKELQDLSLYNINIDKRSNETVSFTFGGFTYKGDTANSDYINSGKIITSRNQSVGCYFSNDSTQELIPKYDGWQILNSYKKDGKIYVTKLIHGGSSENFVFYSDENYAGYDAQYILTSGTKLTGSYNRFKPRNWDMYRDKELDEKGYIKQVYIMDASEVQDISKESPVNISYGIRNNYAYYWLSTVKLYYRKCYLWGVSSIGRCDDNIISINACWGIRPVIELNDGVYIKSGDGTKGSPCVLGMD